MKPDSHARSAHLGRVNMGEPLHSLVLWGDAMDPSAPRCVARAVAPDDFYDGDAPSQTLDDDQ